MLKMKVNINSVRAKAKAAKVFGELNSWSPTKSVTICAVAVVTESSGFRVNFATNPAAITTIIVSPIARDTAKITAPTIEGVAEGKTTFFIISDLVLPMAKAPSFKACGTAFKASSVNDKTKGIIITPITKPAAKALSEAMSIPIVANKFLKKGAIKIAPFLMGFHPTLVFSRIYDTR